MTRKLCTKADPIEQEIELALRYRAERRTVLPRAGQGALERA